MFIKYTARYFTDLVSTSNTWQLGLYRFYQHVIPGAQLALKNDATEEYWSPLIQGIVLESSKVPTGRIQPDDFCTPV